MRLEGMVALVTGAARNVGKGIAGRFAREGAHVVLNDVDSGMLAGVVEGLKREGGSVSAEVVDISDAGAVAGMIERIAAAHGRIDCLVNNAVIHANKGERGPFLEVTGEGWREFTRRNMDAMFFVTQGVARVMAKARSGSVINISSNGAILAHRQSIAYDAWKGAMEAFTRAVAVDLAPWGVRVNALRPIAVAEEAPSGTPAAEGQARLGKMVPMGRIARPSDVAGACVYLASEDAAFVTGQIWNIDGGMLEQSRPPQLELKPVMGPEDIAL